MTTSVTESPKLPPTGRRLAAILAADISGYSRLMGIDEEGTVERVTRQLQALADPIVRQFNGRIFKTMGDGFLAVFDSPLEATRCALSFQTAVVAQNIGVPGPQRLQYRIGINLGDVIATSDDLYGDSVNIAARLQTLAEPGGVCISGSVHDQIKNKLDVKFLPLGEEKLKNIRDPVRVFRVLPEAAVPTRSTAIRPLPFAAAAVGALIVVATAWWWAGLPARQPAAPNQAIGSPDAAVLPVGTPTASSPEQSATANQHREIVFQRMVTLMSDNRYSWRTLERVALEAGVTEAEAHDILADHPHDVTLGRSKEGKVIVRLADH